VIDSQLAVYEQN